MESLAAPPHSGHESWPAFARGYLWLAGPYPPHPFYGSALETPFDRYKRELGARDLQPLTVTRYLQILNSFRYWLDGNRPSPELGRGFIAHLRATGRKPECRSQAFTLRTLGFMGESRMRM